MNRARIILFRGMNTGGVRAAVGDQRNMALRLGLERPRTLAASGNLVVDSDLEPEALEPLIEAAMHDTFGLQIAAMVRTADQWAELIAANPFAREAAEHPSRVLALVMKDRVPAEGLAILQGLARDGERMVHRQLATGGEVLFGWFPNGQGNSAMANKATPRVIGVSTGRNWNTVLKLAEMVCDPAAAR